MPSGRSVLALEYYVAVNARFTVGGEGGMIGTVVVSEGEQTSRFQVILDLGLWYRF